MEIADGCVVTIEYSLRDERGLVLESSAARGPVSFRMGSSRMLPGLARAMQGMRVGETRTGTIPAGQLVPRELTSSRRVALDEFPEGVDPQVGQRFRARADDGQPVMFEVTAREPSGVTVQLLHVLHDVEVHYEVKVLAARKTNVPPPTPGDVLDLTAELVED
jgi:FKBP-type peptidyl-prolyl cis-trans isomerase 2